MESIWFGRRQVGENVVTGLPLGQMRVDVRVGGFGVQVGKVHPSKNLLRILRQYSWSCCLVFLKWQMVTISF